MSQSGKVVGECVRELRRGAKLTQEQLGERAGLSYKFVGEVERGIANPTLDTLERLANALMVDVIDLLKPTHAPQTLSMADYVLVREARASLDALAKRFEPRRPSSKK